VKGEKREKQRRKHNPSCKQAKPEVSTNEFKVRGRISSSLGFEILFRGCKGEKLSSHGILILGLL